MRVLFLLFSLFAAFVAAAQNTKPWSEADRKFLLDNLTRSRDALVSETQNLSEAQWNFKESPERWSIKEVAEHIAIWELLFQRDISQALAAGPRPALAKATPPDSVLLGYMMEPTPKVAVEYTKPFTFAVPMGLGEGKDKIAWLLKLRSESLRYLNGATENLHVHFPKEGSSSAHQFYIFTIGHTDRHLRQVLKIKQHPNYPK
jgi:hypothetical protein